MSVREQVQIIKDKIRSSGIDPDTVTIVAVTKSVGLDRAGEIKNSGVKNCGENRLQDAIAKVQKYPEYKWHFIGHLQSNKAKKVVQYFSMIQSVHSLDLLEKLDKEAEKIGKTVEVLLQVNIAKEPQKFGFDEAQLREQLPLLMALENCHVLGIMVMAPLAEDLEEIRPCFSRAKRLFDDCRRLYPSWTTLSMGMSNDYHIAVEEGATMIRIGRQLFG